MKKVRELTTTTISKKKLPVLKRLCNSFGLNQSEFIDSALDYFQKTGINPNRNLTTPQEEVAKLNRRVNQVIAFIQTFEKEKMLPLLKTLYSLKEEVGKSDIDDEGLNASILGTLNNNILRLIKSTNSLSNAINENLTVIDEDLKDCISQNDTTHSLLVHVLKAQGNPKYYEQNKKSITEALNANKD